MALARTVAWAWTACLGHGAATGIWQSVPRQSKDPPSAGASLPLVQLFPWEGKQYFAAFISLAGHPTKCFDVDGQARKGATLKLWDCPVDWSLLTKFMIPVGKVGPIRLVSAPHLCLFSPNALGDYSVTGFSLELQGCAGDSAEGSFLVRPEEAVWLRYEHWDIRGEANAGSMAPTDLRQVMDFAESKRYRGFSVHDGRAWLKNVTTLHKADLHWMTEHDPVVFYLWRPRGDFTVRLACDPSLCLGSPSGTTPKNGQPIKLLSCPDRDHYKRIEETRLDIHFVSLTKEEQEVLSKGQIKTRTEVVRQPPPENPIKGHVLERLICGAVIGFLLCAVAICLYRSRGRLRSCFSRLQQLAASPRNTQAITTKEPVKVEEPNIWRLGRIGAGGAGGPRPTSTTWEIDLTGVGGRSAPPAMTYKKLEAG